MDFEDFEYHVFAGDLLDSVFRNVPSNAAVHNDDPVAVEVYAAERDRDELAVGFADDGGGIAPEVRERIFQMGVKGPESGGRGSGSSAP